ncbi:SigE family RNA polymerase sigma factor [Kitasatospora sp. NPDC096147]|uniref:SigE family RNA polymerase sigma factor n=1 Tax=Kitasatospora sp. NPDC096147 TaxID=3364093 RepID=UPI00380D1911
MGTEPRDAGFDEYVAARSGWLRTVAFLLCADWHRADDLVQECITKLYVHWPKARRAENLDGYARTVLVNTFLAEQRTGWWRRTVRRADLPERPAAGPDRESSLDLRRALEALPPRQRAAVVLRYYCDLTVEQTAEVLGCSAGNVKSQTSRGLDALRRVLVPGPVAAPGGEA